MTGLRATLLATLCLGLFVDCASAQILGGSGDRDRGLLGRVGARREERLNRNAGAPGANPLPGAANPNAPANPRAAANAAPYGANAATANPSLYNRTAAGIAAARARSAAAAGAPAPSNPYGSRSATSALAPATAAQRGQLPANQAGNQQLSDQQLANQRNSYYAPGLDANTANANATANRDSRAQANTNTNANLVPPAPSEVRQASGSAPVNRLPYNGPGVLVRLPRTVSGEVNYLVDDSEHLVVHSGEDQLLRLKGSYEVRFSRGVTSEGQSYGEARYTITEGVYRFDVSANGWELYREGEARDVAPAVAEAQKRAEEAQRQQELVADEEAERDSSDPLPPLLAPREKQPASGEEKNEKPSTPPPSPAPPASEETLPAPRSILEPT